MVEIECSNILSSLLEDWFHELVVSKLAALLNFQRYLSKVCLRMCGISTWLWSNEVARLGPNARSNSIVLAVFLRAKQVDAHLIWIFVKLQLILNYTLHHHLHNDECVLICDKNPIGFPRFPTDASRPCTHHSRNPPTQVQIDAIYAVIDHAPFVFPMPIAQSSLGPLFRELPETNKDLAWIDRSIGLSLIVFTICSIVELNIKSSSID